MFKFYSLSLLFNPVLLSRDSPRVLIFCLPVQVRCLLLVHKVEQIKFRLLQVNFVRVQGSLIIVFDCLSTLINNSPFFKKKSLLLSLFYSKLPCCNVVAYSRSWVREQSLVLSGRMEGENQESVRRYESLSEVLE